MDDEFEDWKEYEWLIRICSNSFHVFMTMVHLVIYDNILNMQINNPRKGNKILHVNLNI